MEHSENITQMQSSLLLERFNRALLQLEQRMMQLKHNTKQDEIKHRTGAEELQQQNQLLHNQLSEANARYTELRETAEQVEQHLISTITLLESLLHEQKIEG